MTFYIKDFFSKCDQFRRNLEIWSHLRKILNGKLHFFVPCYECIKCHIKPIINKFASFLFGKQYALIYQVVASRFLLS